MEAVKQKIKSIVKSIQIKLYFAIDDENHPEKIIQNGKKEVEAFIKKHKAPMDDMELFTKKYIDLLEEIMRYKERFIYERESMRRSTAIQKRDELRQICRRRTIKFQA